MVLSAHGSGCIGHVWFYRRSVGSWDDLFMYGWANICDLHNYAPGKNESAFVVTNALIILSGSCPSTQDFYSEVLACLSVYHYLPPMPVFRWCLPFHNRSVHRMTISPPPLPRDHDESKKNTHD